MNRGVFALIGDFQIDQTLALLGLNVVIVVEDQIFRRKMHL